MTRRESVDGVSSGAVKLYNDPVILVLCLNAAVDKTAFVPRVAPRRRHRLDHVYALPGGKGINVARALRRLGERPLVLGFVAGHAGDFIARGLRQEGLAARWVRLRDGESRTCLSLLDGVDGPTEFNETGPRVTRAELAELEREFSRLAARARLVVLSGSLPPGCPDGTYARLVRAARAAGKPVLLDTSEAALPLAVAAEPDLAKLNLDEASSLGLKLDGSAGSRRAWERRGGRGGGEAIITLGPRGAAGYMGGRFMMAVPPRIRSLTPIGCGDTFLAGLAHARLRGLPPERSLAFATSVATASAMVLGAGVFRPADVPRVLRGVRLGDLS